MTHDVLADREHDDTPEFRRFRRELFHASLTFVLETLRPGMTKPEVIRYGDGHYRRTLYGLGPYIADYPEQALLACIVQGWCPKCTASNKDLDGTCGRRTHELTEAVMTAFDDKTLWFDYGIISGIMVRYPMIDNFVIFMIYQPFTSNFPRACIHELLSPDILHQLIKGTFKDHLITWIETYIKMNNSKRRAKAILADIDQWYVIYQTLPDSIFSSHRTRCRIASAPSFPNLRRFPDGRGYKQWTGDDSKALMKVNISQY